MGENTLRNSTAICAGLGFAVWLASWEASGELVIDTVAGGGPNNLPALAANLSYPSSVAVDDAGNLYIAAASRIYRVDVFGQLTIFAGVGDAPGIGDGGPAIRAKLFNPDGVTLDGSGNVLIVERAGHRVRRVDANTGIISTVAGNGVPGFSGDGGLATSASLRFPSTVSLDGSGNLYIADMENHRVRRVDAITGIITTVAGNGVEFFTFCFGDGAAATSVSLSFPSDVAVDAAGNLLIADWMNDCIRHVDAITGISTNVATISSPFGIEIDSVGNLIVTVTPDSHILRVDRVTGVVDWIAGSEYGFGFGGDGGPATSAYLAIPRAAALDRAGNLFIADMGNFRIRRVDAASGIITTVAGNGSRLFSGDGAPATTASLGPGLHFGFAVSAAGDLFIADFQNHRVRRVAANTGIIWTVAGTGIGDSTGDGGPANLARVSAPTDVAMDGGGNVFFVEPRAAVPPAFEGSKVRRIDAATGVITTVGHLGSRCAQPAGIALDSTGKLFVACSGTFNGASSPLGRVARLDTTTGAATIVAGGGTPGGLGDGGPATSAFLREPRDVVVDAEGDVLIADSRNDRVRHVDMTTGIITTIAGGGSPSGLGDGGLAVDARLIRPSGLALDSEQNLFIAGGARVRRVDAVTGIISTVAGVETAGFSGDGGPAFEAQLAAPTDIELDAAGNLFVGDAVRIRRISEAITTVALDIKPGSNPNSINPMEQGVIPVAILGSGSFDASEIDGSSLTFAASEAAPAHDLADSMAFADHLEDVNGDGITDLVSHYRTEESGIAYGDMTACLSGSTVGGVQFNGCDSVRTVPDMDGDQLLDVDEDSAGTNAFFRDSDSDGYDDGTEVLTLGTDPLDALDPTPAPVEQRKPSRLRNRRR